MADARGLSARPGDRGTDGPVDDVIDFPWEQFSGKELEPTAAAISV